MPGTVTPVNAWTAIQYPLNAELADSASVLLIAQGAANSLTYLREGIPGKATSYELSVPLFVHGQVLNRFIPIADGGWLQNDITSAGTIIFHLPVPRFGKIDQVHLECDGRDGTFGSAHGGLPATKPTLNLLKATATPGNTNVTKGSLGSATDASASAANYDTCHLISITGLAHTILADTSYWVTVTGEAGANAAANCFAFYRAYAVITV